MCSLYIIRVKKVPLVQYISYDSPNMFVYIRVYQCIRVCRFLWYFVKYIVFPIALVVLKTTFTFVRLNSFVIAKTLFPEYANVTHFLLLCLFRVVLLLCMSYLIISICYLFFVVDVVSGDI
jgi:hypothetical protein